MRLQDCIFITDISASDKQSLELVLQTTKSVMALTKSMPSLDWNFSDDRLLVFGPEEELTIAKLSLRNALGLISDGTVEDNAGNAPFDLAPTVSVDDSITFNLSDNIGAIPVSVDTEWTEEQIDHMEEQYFQSVDTARTELHLCNEPSWCYSNGRPNVNDRALAASALRDISEQWRNNQFIDASVRAEWQTVFDRLDNMPMPTESASGTFSAQEQIDYSETHNPSHWNLVKVRYNGSRYYLSYICPPSVDMDTTLRIVGGRHENDVPAQFEICVYNTEPYWRELRHLMHRQAPFLREAVAA